MWKDYTVIVIQIYFSITTQTEMGSFRSWLGKRWSLSYFRKTEVNAPTIHLREGVIILVCLVFRMCWKTLNYELLRKWVDDKLWIHWTNWFEESFILKSLSWKASRNPNILPILLTLGQRIKIKRKPSSFFIFSSCI